MIDTGAGKSGCVVEADDTIGLNSSEDSKVHSPGNAGGVRSVSGITARTVGYMPLHEDDPYFVSEFEVDGTK